MLLQKGSTGEDVRKLQARLGLFVDGVFGAKTEAAVKQFQAQRWLTVDGIVGNVTWSQLFNTPAKDSRIEALTGKIPDAVIKQLPLAIDKFSITTPLRLAHFLAQSAHESARFLKTSEDLNYSAKRLREIFPKHFKQDEFAKFAKKPQAIANRVYANRMGNGDELSGDGFRYRGRGYLMTTGRNNYHALSEYLRVDFLNQPTLVATDYALTSAAYFFEDNGIWVLCDRGTDAATINAITRRINGGIHGLSDRAGLFEHYYQLLK